MKFRLNILLFILLFAFIAGNFYSCKPKAGHNKYREAKVRPSEKQLGDDKKHIKKGNRAYKKQLRKNRKHLFGTSKGALN